MVPMPPVHWRMSFPCERMVKFVFHRHSRRDLSLGYLGCVEFKYMVNISISDTDSMIIEVLEKMSSII